MPLDQRIRAPLYDSFKKKGLSSSGEQNSVVRTYSRVLRALNTHRRPSSPALPVELWMKIMNELGHKEWIALCRACRSFYKIAQPCLYENIILRVREDRRREICSGRIRDLFERTIDRRPELGAYVRSLLVDMGDRPGPNPWECCPLPFKLHLFPNLKSLDMWHIHINLQLCKILHSYLSGLTSVTVVGCTLHESLADVGIDRDHFPQSSISTVKVLNPRHDLLIREWAALAPAKLDSLTVQSTSRPSVAGLILTRIRELNKTSYLTTLSLDTFSPHVVRFLIASPQLRQLILDPWNDNSPSSPIFSSLPADAIPLLEEYSGPAEFSSTFIQGRPVHTVKFIFPHPILEDRLVEIFISLGYSAVPLTSLGLNIQNATLGSWLSHIPVTVRYLTFDFLDLLNFEKLLPTLSHLTSLQTFSFSGEFYWEMQQRPGRDEIMQISNTCQSLRQIDIGPQRWRIGGQRVWEPCTVFMD